MAFQSADGISPGSSAGDEPRRLSESKLAPPRLHPGLIDRPRIANRLDLGATAPVSLVAAPAGYGKTSAVRAWAVRREIPLAWVTLDARDDDPARLWTYAATAVDRVREGLGRSALRRLKESGLPVETALDELIHGLATFGHEIALVFDDFHVVTDSDCLASVDYIIEHLPGNARMVLVTRSDPALDRLARRRAYGTIVELRADELAFTLDEAEEFLESTGVAPLALPEVETLWDRTEGWPAALVLAALWLREVKDVRLAVQEFGASHRLVADFLTHEVLSAIEPNDRNFLVHAAVLGRFTPELCDAVLGRSDSTEVLSNLERSNLLLARLEHGNWFRLHPLFAEFAKLQLSAEDHDAPRNIHQHAAEWLRSQRLPAEAAEHATAAGDSRMLAEILAEHHLEMIRNGAARTLHYWAQKLPDDDLTAFPEVAAGAATAATMVGGRALERRRLLQLVDRSREVNPDRFGPYPEAVAAMVRAAAVDTSVAEGVASGRRAVELGRNGVDAVLVAALGGYARSLFFAGDLEEAWAAALAAVEHPDAEHRPPGHAFARSTLALVAANQGRIEAARTHAEKAKSIVRRTYSSRSWIGANASVAFGAVLAAEGQLGEAERALAQADQFFRDEVATVHHAWLLAELAAIQVRRGHLGEAEATLRAARENLVELADAGRVGGLVSEVDRTLARQLSRASTGELLEPPSSAELAVLQQLQSELSTREIAVRLYLSANTVRSHTRAIYRKLGVNSRSEAVARADALGLLS